jgi:hypothetical protein
LFIRFCRPSLVPRLGERREVQGETASGGLRFITEVASEGLHKGPRKIKPQPGGFRSRLERLEKAFRCCNSRPRVADPDEYPLA